MINFVQSLSFVLNIFVWQKCIFKMLSLSCFFELKSHLFWKIIEKALKVVTNSPALLDFKDKSLFI